MKTVFTSSKKEARSNAIVTVEQSGHVELFKRFQVDKHLNISDELSSNSYSLAQLNSNQSAGQWEALLIFVFKGLQRYLHCYFHVQLGIQTFFCFPQRFSSTEFLLLLCFIFTDLVLFFLIRNLFVLPVKNSFVIELACCGQYSGTAAGATARKLLGRNMSQGSWLYLASPIATDITLTQIYKAVIETGVKLQPLQPKTSYRSHFKGIKLRVQPCGRSLR